MANASPADARAGFEIFKAVRGRIDLDQLNEQIQQAGYGPVRDRTFRHYRDLVRAGYDRYISVNRFDVARSSKPYENASANGRYQYLPAQIGVRVTLARGDDLVEVIGVATQIGEVGAQLVFEEPSVALALKKAKVHANQTLRLDFLDPPGQTSARVIEAELGDDRAMIEVEFARLQSVVEYVGREALATEAWDFRLIPTSDDDQAADLVGRRIYYFLELLEASRAVVNEFLESNDSDRYATPASIERLRVESPALFSMVVPELTAYIVGSTVPLIGAYWYLQRARLKKGEADEKAQDARAKKIANDVEEAKAGLHTAIYAALKERLTGGDGNTSDRLEQLVDRELVRTVESLAAQDIRSIESGPPK